ncbi:UNVERIFIED_CONTAM: hypothetical protein Slati_2775300 [Sesamum latifolium]|uniref:Reverse transcriptase n=1 Tax=Sesamum latifolium TaxID=2727402 RepID=A0AAW2VY09_9LAMI
MGEASYIIGIKIYRDRSRRMVGLTQSSYIEKVLKRFKMENSNRGFLPMRHAPHWSAVKTILKYIKRTKDMFLIYGGGQLVLEGYSDASFQSDDDHAKSQSGFVFKPNGGVVA